MFFFNFTQILSLKLWQGIDYQGDALIVIVYLWGMPNVIKKKRCAQLPEDRESINKEMP